MPAPRATRVTLAVGLLVGLSCESSSKDAKVTSPTPRAIPQPAPEPTASRPSEGALIDVTREELHVGRLIVNARLSVMQPSEYCLDDGKLYRGARFRLGRDNLFGIDDALEGMEVSGPLAVFGEKRQGLDSQLVEVGPCPENYEPIHVQMRSDWVAPEGGPNTARAKLQSLSYIKGRRAVALHMYEPLDHDDDSVRLRLRNPFSLPFTKDLKFEAHYEGGAGKPMPTYVDKVLSLEPGAWVELELSRRLPGQQPKTKAGSDLRSLEISGRLGKAQLAIELFCGPIEPPFSAAGSTGHC